MKPSGSSILSIRTMRKQRKRAGKNEPELGSIFVKYKQQAVRFIPISRSFCKYICSFHAFPGNCMFFGPKDALLLVWYMIPYIGLSFFTTYYGRQRQV